MSVFYIDTSALVKRHVIEQGSTWLRSWILPRYGHDIYICRLTTVEMLSVLMRRQREHTLTAAQVHQIRKNFAAHVRQQYKMIEMNADVIKIARYLLIRRQLRALDAIQLASALYIRQHLSELITFVAADKNLLTAATAEGLLTDDPNAHP